MQIKISAVPFRIFRLGFFNFVFSLVFFWVFILKFSINFVQAGTDLAKKNIEQFVQSTIKQAFKHRIKRHANTIYSVVMSESKKHDFDPIILLSVIEVESGFKANRRGSHGEIGLMQLKPSTARWVSRKYGMPWHGSKTLEDPRVNIQLGTAYLSHLRKEFSSQQELYLSAYNMGTSNVRKSIRKQVIPKQYASKVLKQYQRFYSIRESSNVSV